MHSKIRSNEALSLLLPSLLFVAWGVPARVQKSTPDLYVQSIVLKSGIPFEPFEPFDTKVSVTVIPAASPPLSNRVYVGRTVLSRDARFVKVSDNSEQAISDQKPFVFVSVGTTTVVSFRFNKAELPKSQNVLRATIKQMFIYKAYTPAGTSAGFEYHTSAGVPIEVPLS